MALHLLAMFRHAVFAVGSSVLNLFASAILVAVVAVVAALAVPTLHALVQTLSVVAQLAPSLVYNTCTSHTCHITVVLSIAASGMAAVLAVKRTWAWLRRDKRRIAMLEQKMRQLAAENHGLRFEVRLKFVHRAENVRQQPNIALSPSSLPPSACKSTTVSSVW